MVKVNVDLSGMKIPKKVAGVKVPKQLRKRAKQLVAKAQSPEGREAIAAGLTIVGAAIAAGARAKAAKRAATAGKPAEPVAPSAPGQAGIDLGKDPIGEAIGAGLASLQVFLAGQRRK